MFWIFIGIIIYSVLLIYYGYKLGIDSSARIIAQIIKDREIKDLHGIK